MIGGSLGVAACVAMTGWPVTYQKERDVILAFGAGPEVSEVFPDYLLTSPVNQTFAAVAARWRPMTLRQKFEDVVIFVLAALITVIIAMAVWSLALKILSSAVPSNGFDPTDYVVFQALFGSILTVIIALEFQRSLMVVTERRHGIVQVRTVVLIALLAIVRKVLILDLVTTDAALLFGLAATILALGAVHRLVRERGGGAGLS